MMTTEQNTPATAPQATAQAAATEETPAETPGLKAEAPALRPCPFCSLDDAVLYSIAGMFHVGCSRCGARTAGRSVLAFGDEKAAALTVGDWNTRAPDPCCCFPLFHADEWAANPDRDKRYDCPICVERAAAKESQ